MAYAEKKDLKLFYTIGEVAEMFKKGGRGVRRYTKDDIEIIRVIYNLVKVRGLRIDAAREVLRKNHEGTVKTTEVVDRLRALRAELVELKAEMGAM